MRKSRVAFGKEKNKDFKAIWLGSHYYRFSSKTARKADIEHTMRIIPFYHLPEKSALLLFLSVVAAAEA